MVTATDLDDPQISKGVILALLSAFFYASYLVLVKRKSDTEEKIDIPLFFGKCISTEGVRIYKKNRKTQAKKHRIVSYCSVGFRLFSIRVGTFRYVSYSAGGFSICP